MKTQTTNMFAATNEDLPIISGMARTELTEAEYWRNKVSSEIVEADSVADFLARYYKPDRYHGRGQEYATGLLKSHEEYFQRQGHDCISRHDSVTGQPVYYWPL